MGVIDRRALMPEDADAARAVIRAALRDTRYLARALEVLDAALAFDDPEFMGLLALGTDGDVESVAIFGAVAGAFRVVKLHGITGGSAAASAALLDGIAGVCRDAGERMIVAEIPDDAPVNGIAAALEEAGYLLEGRLPDFTADGIDLRLYVWRNAATTAT